MIRQNSKEAYKHIIESGILGKLQVLAYETLSLNPGKTASELYDCMPDRLTKVPFSNIRVRLGELREMKAIKECQKRTCDVTGRTAVTWEITGEMPIKMRKKKTRAEKKEEILFLLRDVYKVVNDKKTVKAIANKVKLL